MTNAKHNKTDTVKTMSEKSTILKSAVVCLSASQEEGIPLRVPSDDILLKHLAKIDICTSPL